MSEVFTASNGMSVVLGPGRIDVTDGDGFGNTQYVGADEIYALREFFLHERDETLGRWRSPAGFYVYPLEEINGERVVQVLDELNGQSHCHSEGGGFKGLGIFYEAANDYFAAHPVPKPWHDAEEGDVWLFKGKSDFTPMPFAFNMGSWVNFTGRSLGEKYTKDRPYGDGHDPDFEPRRIWPEVSDE